MIRAARAEARGHVWDLAKDAAPDATGQVTVDLDGVLVLAHSEQQDATATWKKTFGHHPLMAFVDHGSGGSGEPVAGLLRPDNAGSNTAADHIITARLALAQLPKNYRGRRTLIRADSGGGTHELVAWLGQRGRWLSYSVGMTVTEQIHQAVLTVPSAAWTAAVEPEGEIRDGALVAELDGDVLKGWQKGMRLIVRKERPHPGAQLRFTDADGVRSPRSPPTAPTFRSPPSNRDTANAHGPRTASETPAPPVCPTCPRTRWQPRSGPRPRPCTYAGQAAGFATSASAARARRSTQSW